MTRRPGDMFRGLPTSMFRALPVDLFSPIARASDPATSHAGASAIEPKRGTQASEVLAVFRAYPLGLTAAEVGLYTRVPSAWKRVSDLKNAGLVRGTNEIRGGQQVWVAVDTP